MTLFDRPLFDRPFRSSGEFSARIQGDATRCLSSDTLKGKECFSFSYSYSFSCSASYPLDLGERERERVRAGAGVGAGVGAPHTLSRILPVRTIVDEVVYLGLDHEQASLLFQVICCRYEKQAATIITSNKAFSDWGHVFAGDAVMASAALDRLLHRATVINIKGDSYRLKEKRLTGLFPGTVALTDPPKGGARTKTP